MESHSKPAEAEKNRDEGPVVDALRKRTASALFGEERLPEGSPPKRTRWDVGQLVSEEKPATRDGASQNFCNFDHQEVDELNGPSVQSHETRPLFLLDLFCGTAGVTAAFRAIGGDALGIDHMVDKRRVKGPVAKVDLRK